MVTTRHALAAGFWATATLAFVLVLALSVAHRIERRALRAGATQLFSIKNHGIVLQREAFRTPGLLPLYGSSELAKSVSDKAPDFFARAPTGFEVFPVGKAGAASLITLEKLAAIGPSVRGKKLAFSISPSWFWAAFDRPHHYAGNFSRSQANALVFSTALDRGLKRDIARRMLEFPETTEEASLFTFALRRLAGDTRLDRAELALARPLGLLHGLIMRLQDHAYSVEYLLHRVPHPFTWRHRPSIPKWPRLLASATPTVGGGDPKEAEAELARQLAPESDAATFRAHLQSAREWHDLELLLRTLRQLGAQPLLLSMPLFGEAFDRFGISATDRAQFYDRLEALAARYAVPLVDFREHDEDRLFLADTHDHLSPRGWLYFDAALDAFYHDRLPTKTALPQLRAAR